MKAGYDMVKITIEDDYKAVIDIVAYILDAFHSIECTVDTEVFGANRLKYVIHIRSTQT